jgi:hypothetical protein
VQLLQPADGAEHRHPRRLQRLAEDRLVPVAADPVEDDAAEPDAGVEGGEPVHQRGHRPRLRGTVHHEQDRRPQQPGDVRGGGEARLDRRVRGPVEQPHDALDDGDVGRPRVQRAAQEQRGDPLLADHPGVEVAARAPGGEAVVAGVDVVGADLVRRDGEPAGGERRDQSRGHRRLAGVAAGRRHDQARHGHHSMPR